MSAHNIPRGKNVFSRHSSLVVTSRWLLTLTLLTGALSLRAEPIDRYKVVERHIVRVDKVDPWSPLSVGNGDFAFTADVTGFQSLADLYHDHSVPTETLSCWAWHSFPNTAHLKLADAGKDYPFHGRIIRYCGQV